MEGIISYSLYLDFYLIAIILLTLVNSTTIATNGSLYRYNYKNDWSKAVVLGIIFVLYFGLRPIHGIVLGDTPGYAWKYEEFLNNPASIITTDRRDFLFYLLPQIMANFHLPVEVWFTTVATIYIMFNLWGIRKIFKGQTYTAFLFYVVFFLFFSGGTNGIRNADAYSIVFFAISLLYTQRNIKTFVLIGMLFLIAYHIHASVAITIAGFILAKFLIKDTNYAILIWGICIIIALIYGEALSDAAALFIEDDRALKYMQQTQNADEMAGFSKIGFRWDFLLFSALPIVLGWYVTKVRGIKDNFLQLLLNTYILANSVWVIFIYSAFSNRYAMLSWCIYPYVLCYPLLKLKVWHPVRQTNVTILLLWIMVIFTLFISLKG